MMKIKFSPVKGVEGLKAYLQSLPRGVKIQVLRAFSEYIIGDSGHGLKHEPQQVDHGPENPYEWQSERQRTAFFASDGFGAGIPTVRTHKGVESWTMTETNSDWNTVKITGGNVFVQGDWQQRGHKRDGWRTYLEVLASNTAGAYRHAIAKLNEWLKSKGREE